MKWQGKCLENGNPDSLWTYYDSDGQVIWQGYYTGKIYIRQLNEEEYSYTQDTAVTGEYLNGKKEGQWNFYANGKLARTGHYHNGEPTGIWEDYQDECIGYERKKMRQYDYTTQTLTIFQKNGSTTERKIDSLLYNPQAEDFYDENRDYSDEDASSVNMEFVGSAHFISLTALNNHFSAPGYKRFSDPLYYAGISIGGVDEQIFWTVCLSWAPGVNKLVNDTTELNLWAWNADMKFGYDLIPSKTVDLSLYLDVDYEVLKLNVKDLRPLAANNTVFNEASYSQFRNPGYELGAGLHLRINVGYFTLHMDGKYDLDCSSGFWKYNGDRVSSSPKTLLSGFVLEGGIGIHINDN